MTCPRCGGNTGFEWRDPTVMVYQAAWGETREKWECVTFEHPTPLQSTVRCLDCNARIKRAQLEVDDD